MLQAREGAEVEAGIRKRGEFQCLHVPHLLDVEVAQVLRTNVAKGLVSEARGQTALQDFLQIPLLRYPHDFLLERVCGRSGRTSRPTTRVVFHKSADILGDGRDISSGS